MNPQNDTFYTVAKYIDQFPLGRSREVIQSHLTYEEAKKVAEETDLHLSSEDVVIEREDLSGIDSEIAGDISHSEKGETKP